MGTTACKRLCVKRDEYKRYILQGRMKNFDEYMEERQEPFVYFNDYEKMNEEFIKKYKKQFPLRKEIEFKIEENLEHDTLLALERDNVIFLFLKNQRKVMMVIPWFNPLKNNGTCLVVYEVRIYFVAHKKIY